MGFKLPCNRTHPLPAVLFALDNALQVARSPTEPHGRKDKAFQLFAILERLSVIHIELDALLKSSGEPVKLLSKRQTRERKVSMRQSGAMKYRTCFR